MIRPVLGDEEDRVFLNVISGEGQFGMCGIKSCCTHFSHDWTGNRLWASSVYAEWGHGTHAL